LTGSSTFKSAYGDSPPPLAFDLDLHLRQAITEPLSGGLVFLALLVRAEQSEKAQVANQFFIDVFFPVRALAQGSLCVGTGL